MNFQKLSIGLIGCLMLTACAVGEDYQKPKPVVNANWIAPKDTAAITSQANALLKGPWWEQFQDKTLSHLMSQALANNNDLKTAEARIRESRANEHTAWAARLPEVNGVANATRQKYGASSFGVYDSSTQLGLSGDWDLDVAGENRRRDEAAAAEIDATIADRDNVQLVLLSEVAKNYMLLRTAQRQFELTQQNLKFQQDTLDVTNGQRAAGAISDLEVARATAQAKGTAARLPQIETAIAAAINRLNILCGQNPGAMNSLLAAPQALPQVPQSVVVATPISVIGRRPDVRAAEHRLAESAAISNAAFAEFFPKISLSGFLSTESSSEYGAGNPWSAAINGILPLLNFGKIRAGVNAADARQNQAFYNYQQTILLALEETENALTSYLNEQKRRDTLAIVAAEEDKAAIIAREQYKAGVTTQLDLLTAEENKLDSENDLALSNSAVAQNLIALYRALSENTGEDVLVSNPSMAQKNEPSKPLAHKTILPPTLATETKIVPPFIETPVTYENGVMIITGAPEPK
jgi:NodT family efflux transporter outer membrane factor (OMF) lipoprotein